MTDSKQPLLDFWRSALHDAGIRLSASVNRVQVLKLRLNGLRNLYLNAPDDLQRMRLEAEIARILNALKVTELEEATDRETWRRCGKEALQAGIKPEEIKDLQREPPQSFPIFDDSEGRGP